MTNKPILFLDFDGVLHPNDCPPDECFKLLPELATTLTPFDLDIVISSSWRFHYSRRYMGKLFPATVRGRIVGVTGEADAGPYARWAEIRTYLRERPASTWRALDDFDWEFPAACPQLIRCDGSLGCQASELERLEQWLSGNARRITRSSEAPQSESRTNGLTMC